MPTTRTSPRHPDQIAAPHLPRHSALPFTICATLYLGAAAATTALNLNTPFTRGWWLVAYLSLVGGISQLLLGPGLLAIARSAGTAAPDRLLRTNGAQLVLWNLGTIIVAAASMARIPLGVPAGSLLLTALALFTTAQHTLRRATDNTNIELPWLPAYTALRWFLALSVLVGNLLAYRGYES